MSEPQRPKVGVGVFVVNRGDGKIMMLKRKNAHGAGVFAQEMEDYLDYVRNSGKYISKTVDLEWDALKISQKL